MSSYSDGSVYDGPTNDVGERHGKGRLTFANGDVYEGDFAHDQMHGQGRYEYHNRSVYEGSFYEGQQHGQGTYDWPDGRTKYVGPFANGQPHGDEGTLYFSWRGSAAESRANSYTCSWEMGQMAPRGGRFTDHNGKTVVAQPHEDIRSLVDYKSVPQTGQHKGKFYFQGAVYEGAWNGKMPHGRGTMTFDDGAETKYDGSFMQGLFAGQGKLFSAARGAIYSGQWADGRPAAQAKGVFGKSPQKGPRPS